MEAEWALSKLKQHYRFRPEQLSSGPMPVRIHQCWDCDGQWHLTTLPLEEYRGARSAERRQRLDDWSAREEKRAIEAVRAFANEFLDD